MVRELIRELRTATALGGVTEREAQVLGMLRRGHSTAEIASRLQISPVTVRRYISELVRKLGVDNRAALVGFDDNDADRSARRRSTKTAPARPAPPRIAWPEPAQARPLRTAYVAAWMRLGTSSFDRMLETWFLAVRGLMLSSTAISVLSSPRATS